MVFKHHLTHGPKLLEGIACHMPLVERLSLCTFKKGKKTPHNILCKTHCACIKW